jgi:hypothetical protein
MSKLEDAFNALHERHVAEKIRVSPAPEGRQTIQVDGRMTDSGHRFTYFSHEHEPEKVDEALAHVSRNVLHDHEPGEREPEPEAPKPVTKVKRKR